MSARSSAISGEELSAWLTTRRERLTTSILDHLGLQEFRAGMHTLRDHRGWKMDVVDVRGVWIALVLPSLHPYAALAVMDSSERALSVFAVERVMPAEVGDPTPIQIEEVEIPSDWRDPVAEALRHIDLYETEPPAYPVIDGIGYTLDVATPHVVARLRLSNPQSPAGKDLQRRTLEAAEGIVAKPGGAFESYLGIWRRFVGAD